MTELKRLAAPAQRARGIALLLLAAACGSTDSNPVVPPAPPPPPPAVSPNQVTVKINNVAWTSTRASASYIPDYQLGGQTYPYLVISGANEANSPVSDVYFGLNLSKGTAISVAAHGLGFAQYTVGNCRLSSADYTLPGSVVITMLSTTRVIGRFTFVVGRQPVTPAPITLGCTSPLERAFDSGTFDIELH